MQSRRGPHESVAMPQQPNYATDGTTDEKNENKVKDVPGGRREQGAAPESDSQLSLAHVELDCNCRIPPQASRHRPVCSMALRRGRTRRPAWLFPEAST